jgi:hypothetical protein
LKIWTEAGVEKMPVYKFSGSCVLDEAMWGSAGAGRRKGEI